MCCTKILPLLRSKCCYGILLRRTSGGDETRNESQRHTDNDKDRRNVYGKLSRKIRDTRQVDEDSVERDAEQVGRKNAHDTRSKADDNSLGVEHT